MFAPSPPSGERAGVRGQRVQAKSMLLYSARRPLTLTLSPDGGEGTALRNCSPSPRLLLS